MSKQSPPSPAKVAAPKIKFTDAKANSLANKVLRLELLQTNLAPLLDSMPHVKPAYAELVQLLADAKSHEFQLQNMKVDRKKVVADRRALIQRSDELRSRIASALAFEHGTTSAQLERFGIRPRPSGGGRKKKSTPEPDSQQPEVPTPAGAHPVAPATGEESSGTAK